MRQYPLASLAVIYHKLRVIQQLTNFAQRVLYLFTIQSKRLANRAALIDKKAGRRGVL